MKKMTIIETIKAASSKLFPNGEGFTCKDFGNIGLTPLQIRTALTRLSEPDLNHVKLDKRIPMKNGTSLNQYRLVKTHEIDTECESGEVTIFHRGNVIPVNHCGDNETYEVMLHGTDEIECYAWRGFWQIPQVYIKGWRGVTR